MFRAGMTPRVLVKSESESSSTQPIASNAGKVPGREHGKAGLKAWYGQSDNPICNAGDTNEKLSDAFNRASNEEIRIISEICVKAEEL